MGWFWNSAPSSSSSSPSDDALSTLDPKLKSFLASSTLEQQQKQQQQQQQQQQQHHPPPPPQHSPPTPAPQPTPSAPSSSSSVPTQSLFQDGRYASLWQTYTPPSAPSPSSQDQLQSLLSDYSSRRAEVARAALENCVEEHLAENACFGGGTLRQKMGGCRAESRAFARCYEVQARLLRAMGWMDVTAAGTDEERRRDAMRMRADEVWTEMRRREAEDARALAAGGERREWPPLELKSGWVKRLNGAGGGEMTREEREGRLLGVFTEDKRKELEMRLAKLPPAERELELKLEIAEAEVHRGYGRKVGEYAEMEKVERRQRREKGESTVGDWLKSIGGWSQ